MATPRLPATPVTPVTPAAQKQQQPTPTGSWRHPKLYEITRRQHATAFDERNVRTIFVNGLVLAISFFAYNSSPTVAFTRLIQGNMASFAHTLPYFTYIIWAVRVVFLANIGLAAWPLVLKYYPDDVADIPLTPSQRQAMGLDPSVSTPPTPGYESPNYITPPRYQRSTPRSSLSTPGERDSSSGSRRNSLGLSTSHSPFSPSGNGSPLFQKVIGGSASKRLGFDRSSPLDSSLFSDSSFSSNAPSTPTPGNGKASVGLNSKWLYEKRRDSRGSSFY